MTAHEPHRVGPRASPRRSVVVEILLWVTLLVVLAVTLVIMGLQALSATGCGDVCRYDLLGVSARIFFIGLVVAVVGAIALRIALAVRHRRGLWAPLTGTALVLLVFVASFVVQQIGYAPMYERNERAATAEAATGAP